MAIRVQADFIRKGTVRLIYYHYDDDGDLIDATSVAISVVDADGTVVVDEVAMNKTATGVYEYYYTTTTGVVEGDYQVEVAATDGSYVSYAQGSFRMAAGINE